MTFISPGNHAFAKKRKSVASNAHTETEALVNLYHNKYKRPTPIAGRECSPYSRDTLKIYQIFGFENKS